MRKRINELLQEKFEYGQDSLVFSEESLEHQARKGKGLRGKFTLHSREGRILRGALSASDPRIQVRPEMFTGRFTQCSYTIDIENLQEGCLFEGRIFACTTVGEYSLPVRVQIQESKKKSGGENTRITLEELTALAREDYGKAYIQFVSPQFRDAVMSAGERARALYEGLTVQPMTYHCLEQFLVGMNQKPPVTLRVQNTHIRHPYPQEDTREELVLTKEIWGFAPVHISCGEDFLTLEKTELTTEEFVGSVCSVGYVIHKDRLHAGRNFAQIRVVCECREILCDVEVQGDAGIVSHQAYMRQKQEVLQMANSYIGLRCGRMTEKEWAGVTLQNLENYKKAGGDHIFFDLYRIYALLLSGFAVQAQIALQEVTARKRELVIPQWKGLYLYLTIIGNADKTYLQYVKEEIRDLFLANQENWILQWLMLRVNPEDFRGDAEKLDAIRRQYACGCISPVMYLEAWEILKREPLMLRTLGDFEVRLLRFLCRENLIDREICGQTAQLAARLPAYDKVLYGVLCRCFEKYPSKNMLTAICSLLMKGHKSSPQYNKWFALGVKQDVRLAGLYEYYALTAEDLNVKELPQSVRMYFSYNNMLGYEKKAAIYANIIRNRGADPETYETYRPTMALFMEEQLREGRINEDLALLYEVLLTEEVLDEPMRAGLAKVLFTYELICSDPLIRHVVVVHRQLRQEQRVMLTDGKALVQLYSDHYSLLGEDAQGTRFADTSVFAIKRLLARESFEEYCRRAQKVPQEILLHDCCADEQGAGITKDTLSQYTQLLQYTQIRDDYRRDIQERLLGYFTDHPQAEELERYLANADYEELSKAHMGALTELLVGAGMCEEAYALVSAKGAQHVSAQTLVRLCSWKIGGQQEEDAHLLALCMRCFAAGIYDEAVLAYLLRYFEGELEMMKKLWLAGQGFDVENFAFEEKILALVLFMQSGEQDTEVIFDSYRKKQGKPRICRAYAVWMSYCSFVREQEVAQPVFDYIEKTLNGEMNMPEICRLALFRKYAYTKKLTAGQQKWLSYFMERYTEKGMRFRFFNRLPGRLLRRFYLHDKYFLEYRGDPRATVTLHYQLNGGRELSVPMNHVYEGIFVNEFTLFYQDSLSWYLTIEEKEQTRDTERQTIVCSRRFPRGTTGQYELLCRLTEACQRGDAAQIKAIREQYIGQQYFVDEFFGVN